MGSWWRGSVLKVEFQCDHVSNVFFLVYHYIGIAPAISLSAFVQLYAGKELIEEVAQTGQHRAISVRHDFGNMEIMKVIIYIDEAFIQHHIDLVRVRVVPTMPLAAVINQKLRSPKWTVDGCVTYLESHLYYVYDHRLNRS